MLASMLFAWQLGTSVHVAYQRGRRNRAYVSEVLRSIDVGGA